MYNTVSDLSPITIWNYYGVVTCWYPARLKASSLILCLKAQALFAKTLSIIVKIAKPLVFGKWHAPTKDTTSYVRVKDSLASGAGGRYPRAL